MNNEFVDPVFGEMYYKHSWIKSENDLINFFGQNLPLKIVAQAYKGENVLAVQQNAYSHNQDKLESIIDQQVDALLYYCQNFPEETSSLQKSDIPKILTPHTLLFQRDGSWGILFDYEKDQEHGLALFHKNGDWHVGSQDSFL